MRRPSVFLRRSNEYDSKLTPLIDVVFLLMVFFVWTSSFQVVERLLPSKVTAASGTGPATVDDPPPPEADFEPIVIRIQRVDDRPTWKLNATTFTDVVALEARLKQIASIQNASPVILHPDAETPLGDVVDVYDVARRAGFEQVQFTASR